MKLWRKNNIYSALTLIGALAFFIAPQSAFALTKTVTSTASVSATVVEQTFTPAKLISPTNGSITTNPFEPFVFRQAVSTNGISHYDLYIDGQIVAGNISDTALNQDAYFYTTIRNSYDNIIYVYLKNRLAEGSHIWHVNSFSNGGTTVDSDYWRFTLDSITPIIILTNVDQNRMYWTTNDPTTIPPEDQRHLLLRSNSPLLQGKVEAFANLKISVICPVSAPIDCQSTSITTNYPDGTWQDRLHNLLPNVEYLVYLIAVDAANNINNFPVFYITFPTGAKPTATASPIVPSPSIIPSPNVGEGQGGVFAPNISLGDYFRQPPPAPPLNITPSTPPLNLRGGGEVILPYLYFLIFFGLLIHLLMTLYGAQIRLSQTFPFLLNLLLPILGPKPNQVEPFFTTIAIFDPDKLNQAAYITVSNILAKANIKFPDHPENIFIRLTRPGYEVFKAISQKSQLKPGTPLKLKPKDHPSALERLQLLSLSTRVIPLLIADITSGIVLLLAPGYFVLFYFLISLDLTYAEYLFPKIQH